MFGVLIPMVWGQAEIWFSYFGGNRGALVRGLILIPLPFVSCATMLLGFGIGWLASYFVCNSQAA
jgi:hypothetical protein